MIDPKEVWVYFKSLVLMRKPSNKRFLLNENIK